VDTYCVHMFTTTASRSPNSAATAEEVQRPAPFGTARSGDAPGLGGPVLPGISGCWVTGATLDGGGGDSKGALAGLPGRANSIEQERCRDSSLVNRDGSRLEECCLALAEPSFWLASLLLLAESSSRLPGMWLGFPMPISRQECDLCRVKSLRRNL